MKIIADENIPFVADCFSSLGDVTTLSGRDITASVIKDTDVLIVRSITKIDEKLLQGSSVKFVGTATIGFEHIDVEYLKQKKIGFASAPGSNANSVAEYIIAGLLEIAQKLDVTLEGKSIGIIGVGNVGSKVAQKCVALDMKLFLNDPPLHRQTGDSKYLPLESLFDCDVITLHTPLTFDGLDKTYHLADEKFFDSLKAGCVFINTARGAVVDSNTLKKEIKSGKLSASILDVWENEPDIDTELLSMVDIATPHIAGYSLDGKIAGMIMIYEAVCKYFGLPIEKNIVDFLPESDTPQIKIENIISDEQEILHQTVKKIYDITKDDADLRRILNLPQNKRAFIFDRLRKTYRIRREFQNTTCVLATEGIGKKLATEVTENTEKKLEKKLKGIGFKVSENE